MKYNNKIIGTLALYSLYGIGPAFVKKATTTNSFNNSNLFDEIKDLTEINNKHFDDETIFQSIESAKETLSQCTEEGITIIDLHSDNYPISLRELKDPPSVIYCRGNIDLLYEKIICIIGTREPNKNGIKIADRISLYFNNNNWAICNGLAEGIDNFSIKTNELIHNKIIGILAGGLNYNSKKTILKKTASNAEMVLENNGLLISEMPPDKKEDTISVVKSCRIQAGISQGLILIQSSLDGGSKFTTKAFCETNRPIGIINPFKSDIDLPAYDANKEIITNHKKGLSKFVGIKEEKILTSKIFIIKSKEDYRELEELMNKGQINIEHNITTLFS